MSSVGQMGKENRVYSAVLFSHDKEWNPISWCHMDATMLREISQAQKVRATVSTELSEVKVD